MRLIKIVNALGNLCNFLNVFLENRTYDSKKKLDLVKKLLGKKKTLQSFVLFITKITKIEICAIRFSNLDHKTN